MKHIEIIEYDEETNRLVLELCKEAQETLISVGLNKLLSDYILDELVKLDQEASHEN